MATVAPDPQTRGQRVARNITALLASQPLTWLLTLIFTVIVPRNVGPGEWGEWVIAASVGQLAAAALDFGLNTVVFKSVSRYPEDSRRTLGAVLAIRFVVTPALVLGMIGFSLLAAYSEHTRLIVVLAALRLAIGYLATPIVNGLQAFEKMHVTALVNVLGGLILTGGAVAMVKFFALGVVSISVLAFVAQLFTLIAQLIWLNRIVRVRPVLKLHLAVRLLRDGLPYWASFGFFTVYVWLDGIMLSLMGSTRENGWYGVATQVISTLGFLPYAVTTAVFPALSRSIHADWEASAALAGRSFRFLVTLSLPMSVGLALVAGNLVTAIYGAWFWPASLPLAVLALTLPPVYVATVVNGFIIAADKQVQWTCVMGAMCVLNLLLNLFCIPYFHGHYGNGALGAALALLATDCVTGIAALALLPASLLPAVRATLPAIAASALATVAMAAAVWPLRGLLLPVPVLAGAVAFLVPALLLRVFPRDELNLLGGLARTLARKLLSPLLRQRTATPATEPTTGTDSEVA
jgi:O-antigen/teichoic acid export membrane protein